MRDRLASCVSDCLEGMMDGDSTWSTLLEAYPKLILRTGLRTLLHRINLQEEAKNRDNDKETESEKRSKRAARAKRLATEGALFKA
eukprot:12039230-Heterocapsa_arctica.AAC.1